MDERGTVTLVRAHHWVSQPPSSLRALVGAVAIAAVLACGLSILAECRLVDVVSVRYPAQPLLWSKTRFMLIAILLFLALGPLAVWITRGGIGRAFDVLRADSWRVGRRLLEALLIALVAGAIGWLVGVAIANLKENAADWRYSFIAMAGMVAIALGWFYRGAIRANAEWGYLICGLAVGLVLVAIMPIQPNANWDGAIHFNTANAISYGRGARYDGGDLISLDGVPYVKGFGGKFGNRPDFSLEAVSETAEAIDEHQGDIPVYISEGTLRHESSTWVMPSAVGNLPAGMGLWFGRLLGLPNSGELTCARLFNLLTYIFLWFFGIRYLKSAKLVFASLALIPVSLFQAANFSYDPWLIAMLGLATCRYVGELQRPEEPLSPSHALAILVPLVLACMVKAIYFPMALGFWALGRGKFPTGRQWRRWLWRFALLAIAVGLMVSFMLPFFERGGEGYSDNRGGEEVNSQTQLELVLNDPLVFVRATATTASSIVHPSYLGDSVGLLSYMPPSDLAGATGIVYFASMVVISLFARTEADRPYAGGRFKVLALLGVAGAYVLFTASLYISFTAVGADTVAGFQPKYLLPMYPALLGVVLNFPGIARIAGRRIEVGLPMWYWLFIGLYYVAFLVIRFVVFF